MFTKVMDMLNAVDDIAVSVNRYKGNTVIDATVIDFDGFNDDWSENILDFDEKAVYDLEAALERFANKVYGDFYRYFEFDGFIVQLGYASMDI